MVLSPEEIEKRVSDSYELPNEVLSKVPNPMVSIRTSTYNHGPYIRQCIEGVLMQKTTFSFEYIIGEDCSTDETREIVLEYSKKYPNIIRVVTADYNVGSKANGRRCIQRCRGKYMAICEGDDYWIDPLKLQKQFEFLEQNEEYSMCFHRCKEIFDGINKEKAFLHLESREYTGFDILKKWSIPTASVLFRNYGDYLCQNCNGIFYGDIFLFLLLAEKGKLYCLPDIMSVYRRNLNGVTSLPYNTQLLYSYFRHYKSLDSFFKGKYHTILETKILMTSLGLIKRLFPNPKCLYYLYIVFLSPRLLCKFLYKKILKNECE